MISDWLFSLIPIKELVNFIKWLLEKKPSLRKKKASSFTTACSSLLGCCMRPMLTQAIPSNLVFDQWRQLLHLVSSCQIVAMNVTQMPSLKMEDALSKIIDQSLRCKMRLWDLRSWMKGLKDDMGVVKRQVHVWCRRVPKSSRDRFLACEIKACNSACLLRWHASAEECSSCQIATMARICCAHHVLGIKPGWLAAWLVSAWPALRKACQNKEMAWQRQDQDQQNDGQFVHII